MRYDVTVDGVGTVGENMTAYEAARKALQVNGNVWRVEGRSVCVAFASEGVLRTTINARKAEDEAVAAVPR